MYIFCFKVSSFKNKYCTYQQCQQSSFVPQLTQALSGRFNSHVHVEYEWRLLHEDLDESDDDMDEKLQVCIRKLLISCAYICVNTVFITISTTLLLNVGIKTLQNDTQ